MALTTQHFLDQHRQLLSLSDQLTRIVDGRDLESRALEVRAAVDLLAAHLRQHLDAEDRGLYAELLRSSDPTIRSTAERFGLEMGGLKQAFSAYLVAWPEHAIRTDAVGFSNATRRVLEALRLRIEREDSTLYPLAKDISVSAPGSNRLPLHGSPPLVYVVDDNDGDFILLKEAWRETPVACTFEYFPVAQRFLDHTDGTAIPDLIITDINMPFIGGRELVQRIREMPRYARVPIVMCSSACGPKDSDNALAWGATGFFPKPATFAEYLPFVNTMNDLMAFHREA